MKRFGDALISAGQQVLKFESWLYLKKWEVIATLDDRSLSLGALKLQCPRWIVRAITLRAR